VSALLAALARDGESSLRAELDGDPKEVRDGITAAVLRLAMAAFLDGSGALSLPERLVRAERATRDAGLATPHFADPSRWAVASPRLLGACAPGALVDPVLDALTDANPNGSPAEHLGALYEELLELGVRRLEADAVCLRPQRTWIASRDVLREPAATRSRWVQREAGLPKTSVQKLGRALAEAVTERDVREALLAADPAGAETARSGDWVLDASKSRRRSGSHFTPRSLCRVVLSRTLSPLVEEAEGRSERLLSLRICDPAMGSGAFLVETALFLAEHVLAAWRGEGRGASREEALVAVRSCLYGVDRDPVAVDLARFALAELTPGSAPDRAGLVRRLRCGDALIGRSSASARRSASDSPAGTVPFDWPAAFPEVFERARSGFDACVGNPPWVAYAGRAAQPLAPELARYYARENPAFAGYRTLHGLFVRRAAELLREGGRLGLVLPTSIADLEGYAPARCAHDALAEPDRGLTDVGDGAFDGVFQPCMALTSTRRAEPSPAVTGAPWILERTDLDALGTRLLERLDALPKVPETLFGERGFQTTGNDLSHLRRLDAPEEPFTVPLREGVDVTEFAVRAPRTFLNPVGLTGRFRAREDWLAVRVLIRQTARYPIAALSDGVAFRNSILAGFSAPEWSSHALVAYLNSSAVRWFHYFRHRDARQGMPQVKIGHLRALPSVGTESARECLDAFGRTVNARGSGLAAGERAELDRLVFDALDFDEAERTLVLAWSRENPLPRPRK
jgi:hypothetical protein